MTDPNQNQPPRPDNWSHNPYGNPNGYGQQPQTGLYGQAPQGPGPYGQQPQPGPYGQAPQGPGPYGQQWQTGQPGQQYVYGQPGPGTAGGNGGNGKIVASVIGALVVVIAVAVVLLFVVRGDDDPGSTTAATSSPFTSLASGAPLDDTLTSSDPQTFPGNDPGDTAGDNSLSPSWVALIPASVNSHLELCRDTSFDIYYIDDSGSKFPVDGASCFATGSLELETVQQVDILADEERVTYLDSVLNGTSDSASGMVFRQDGNISVGVSDVEASTGVTLFYLDRSSSLSIEVIGFSDPDAARQGAHDLGLL